MTRIPFYRRKPDKFDGYDFAEDLMPDYLGDDEEWVANTKINQELKNNLDDSNIMI